MKNQKIMCRGKDGNAWVLSVKKSNEREKTVGHIYDEPLAHLIVNAVNIYPEILEFLYALIHDYWHLDTAYEREKTRAEIKRFLKEQREN